MGILKNVYYLLGILMILVLLVVVAKYNFLGVGNILIHITQFLGKCFIYVGEFLKSLSI